MEITEPLARGRPPKTGGGYAAKIRRARAEQMVRMSIAGIGDKEIGLAHGISDRRVRQIMTWAEQEGIVAETVAAIRVEATKKLLPKLTAQYEGVLDNDAETLQKNAKGHQLKLAAARDLAKGLGVFVSKTEATNRNLSVTGGMSEYLEARRLHAEQNAPAAATEHAADAAEGRIVEAEIVFVEDADDERTYD